MGLSYRACFDIALVQAIIWLIVVEPVAPLAANDGEESPRLEGLTDVGSRRSLRECHPK